MRQKRKVIYLVVLVFCFHLTLFPQNINLSISNVTVKTVIETLKKDYGYSFVFESGDVNTQKIISVSAQNQSVNDVVKQILQGQDLSFEIKDKSIIVHKINTTRTQPAVSQQGKRITGTVIDEQGEPVIGANVVEKGTTNGTITDVDGRFTLNVSQGAVLIISFIGYTSVETPVGNQTSLMVALKRDTKSLDEVVVIGYGTQRKVTLTGSVTSVKGDDIAKSPTINVANSLAGRLSGVTVNNRSGEPGNDDPKIYIRGRSTTGKDDVLVIIDGIEREGLGQLNPNDIETITVLKDASAAIYGARAANGVILVTTKRGTNARPIINLSYNQGYTQQTRKPRVANSYQWGLMYNEIEDSDGRPDKYTADELRKFQDGSDPYYPNTDWYDFITKKLTPQHRTNLSVSGGSERSQYYISFGEVGQSGHFKNGTTQANQYNIRSNVDTKITDWFKVSLNLAGRYDKNHYPTFDNWNLYSHIFLDQPDWQPYWPGTDLLYPCRGSESLLNRVDDTAGFSEEEVKVLQGSLAFRIDVPQVKGLWVDLLGSYDTYHTFVRRFEEPTYVYFKNAVTGELEKGRSAYGSDLAQLRNTMTMRTFSYLTAKVNYEHQFDVHNVAAMFGYEQQQIFDRNFWAERGGFLSTALPELFAGSSDKTLHSNDGKATQGARQNYYGRLTYDYSGKYLAQLTFRYDGSPNFPADKRFGFFPSASAGWRLSEEPFMQDFEHLNNLKIRGSYGKMGNDLVNAFQYLTAYGYGNPYVIGNKDVNGLIQSGVPNPNITWETAVTWNAGFDAQMWDGLFGIEFDYFKTRRSDILTKRTAIIPDYTGLTLPDENIGIVDNRGFEISLTHDNKIGNVKYHLSGNVSFARNKVIFSDEQPAAEPYQMATGRPIGAELYYVSLGIFKDQADVDSYPHFLNAKPGDIKYEDVNKDGNIDSRDRIRIGETSTPEIMYGLTASFEYKSFDLALLFQGQENAKTYFGGYFPILSYSLGNFSSYRWEDHWTPEHTNATMPRASLDAGNNNVQSTHWLFDAGFLRVKNVELGYNLPKRLCEKMMVQNVRISVSANNFFIIYDHMKKLGYDPEAPEYWYYPQQRTYNAGINLTF
ncbi:TonB-dependent receptor SusC [termite gut metagenome]|uniref:TonB-dependent receptor SusC n=1 Tax=termite gut metagenome TaxID=433724 RepID=A0A5J4S4B9_9ZZZZ